jgi:hypothetical protein
LDAFDGERWAGINIPWVASAACWRKTVEFELEEPPDGDCEGEGEGGRGNCKMSMGMESLWHAKMAFMMGMYWWARSVEGEAEMSRMRDWSV